MESVFCRISSGCNFLDSASIVLNVKCSCVCVCLVPGSAWTPAAAAIWEDSSLVQPVCLFAEESSMQIGLGRKCTWSSRFLPFSMYKLSLLAQSGAEITIPDPCCEVYCFNTVMMSVRRKLQSEVDFRSQCWHCEYILWICWLNASLENSLTFLIFFLSALVIWSWIGNSFSWK